MSRNPKEEVSEIMGRLIKGTETPAEEKEERFEAYSGKRDAQD